MPVDIGKALSDGFDRTIQKNGLLLVGIVTVVAVARSIVEQSMLQQIFQDFIDELAAEASGQNQEAVESARQGLSESFPLAFLDVSPGVLSVVVLGTVILGIVIDIGAVRTFVSGERERLPLENFTRRLLWTLLNLVVGFVLYGIVVAVGTALLVLPGIYLAVALFFYNYEIIVEEKNVFEALSGSWRLTSGNRLLLFVIGLIFVILDFIVFFIPPGGLPLALVSNLVSAFIGVFGIAVASQAYNQLRGSGVDDGTPQPDIGGGPARGESHQGRTPGAGTQQGTDRQGPNRQGTDRQNDRGTGQRRDDEF